MQYGTQTHRPIVSERPTAFRKPLARKPLIVTGALASVRLDTAVITPFAVDTALRREEGFLVEGSRRLTTANVAWGRSETGKGESKQPQAAKARPRTRRRLVTHHGSTS
jgi:hypothetical protein